jgi:hypothetical protein
LGPSLNFFFSYFDDNLQQIAIFRDANGKISRIGYTLAAYGGTTPYNSLNTWTTHMAVKDAIPFALSKTSNLPGWFDAYQKGHIKVI